jgi:hypothetical protein
MFFFCVFVFSCFCVFVLLFCVFVFLCFLRWVFVISGATAPRSCGTTRLYSYKKPRCSGSEELMPLGRVGS